MKTKKELQSEIDTIDMDIRSMMNDVKDASKDVNIDEVRAKKAELETRRAGLVKELAQCDAPVDAGETRSTLQDEFRKLARGEVRGITIGSTGNVNQIKQLFNEVANKDDILDQASLFYGPNAATNIPVLAPLTDPAAYAEAATDVSVDTDASVATTQIAPKAHVSVLPVSAEMLEMGAVDFEAELSGIFQKTFRRVMHKEMIVGSGANTMTGVFVAATGAGVTSAGSVASNATAIKISDLVSLALAVSGKDEEYSIVLNPSVYQGALADSTAGEDVKLYKESLIRDKSIEGVKVILDRNAPNTFGTGKILAVACPLSRYAIGIGGEIRIKTINVKGDTNTYFQAEMFFNGKQISATDLACIKTA